MDSFQVQEFLYKRRKVRRTASAPCVVTGKRKRINGCYRGAVGLIVDLASINSILFFNVSVVLKTIIRIVVLAYSYMLACSLVNRGLHLPSAGFQALLTGLRAIVKGDVVIALTY